MAPPSITATPSPARVREDRAIFRALRIIEQRANTHGPLVSDAGTAGQLFRLRLGNEPREHFEAAFLDNRHRLLAVERLFSGTIDGATVHPRVVIQRALALNAAAMIVAHNHPSGDPTPSAADKMLTNDLRASLALVDIRLLDHIVVTATATISIETQGLLQASPSRAPVTALPTKRRRAGKS